MERYVCIHGHFYQPPRENPWLEEIELQDSAYPYHDWNERITAECYATNAASRILGERDQISRIVNNYSRISFNFGPTLLAWMETNTQDVYRAVLEADMESRKSFSGHGSALAQAYNHMILPLANRRDKYTQILWGIRDFERRFGRQPEGMWLPEAAADLESLDIMAELKIRFTILAPHQAARVRRKGMKKWYDVSGGRVDPTMPYTLSLPSGRSIDIFFYDGPISRAVAFEGLLSNGEVFANRLVAPFSQSPTGAQIVHIATDGETYGHHHRFGDMALAYTLHHIETNKLARLTNYGEYLAKYPPSHEAEIFENTSWSCAHGVERWRSHCGCNTGGHVGWSQGWRAPLREALNWLRDAISPKYEEVGPRFFGDPWAARDDYIDVVLDRSPDFIDRFLKRHATRQLEGDERITALKLLEIQRHAMLMYTSCGWFFDDLSGIETVQIIQYAGRALQLAQELFGDAMEEHFLNLLGKAKSNVPEYGDGRKIYEKFVRPAMIDLVKLGAHFAVSSMFEDYSELTSIYCYTVDLEDCQTWEVGRAKLALGRASMTSEITLESKRLTFGVLNLGGHNLNCGVREYRGGEVYQAVVNEICQVFYKADFPETIRLMDKHFGASTHSLKSLFRDEQRKILDLILEETMTEVEAAYRRLYEQNIPLLRFLKDTGVPPPKALYGAAEFVLNSDLRKACQDEEMDTELVERLLEEAQVEGVHLDAETIEYTLRKNLERMAELLSSSPMDHNLLQRLEAAAGLARSMPFEVNLWKVQNICYDLIERVYPAFWDRAEQGDELAQEWIKYISRLAEKVGVQIS